jgi:hypothetical protein
MVFFDRENTPLNLSIARTAGQHPAIIFPRDFSRRQKGCAAAGKTSKN